MTLVARLTPTSIERVVKQTVKPSEGVIVPRRRFRQKVENLPRSVESSLWKAIRKEILHQVYHVGY